MAEARIGVVGATGAVGTVTLALLSERGFGHVRVDHLAASQTDQQLGHVGGRGGVFGSA